MASLTPDLQPAVECYHPVDGTKLYGLVTGAHVCDQLSIVMV